MSNLQSQISVYTLYTVVDSAEKVSYYDQKKLNIRYEIKKKVQKFQKQTTLHVYLNLHVYSGP